MHESYYDSADGEVISRKRALKELRDHQMDEQSISEFFDEMGDCESYSAQAVLDWLGY